MTEKSIVLEGVSLSVLKRLISEGVTKSYYDLTCKLKKKYEHEDLMTREEAADFLKINLSTLYYWTKDGRINSYAIANRKYYKKSDILNALNPYGTNKIY